MLHRYRIVFEYGGRLQDTVSLFSANELPVAREVFAMRVAEIREHYDKHPTESRERAITLWRGDVVLDEWRYGE